MEKEEKLALWASIKITLTLLIFGIPMGFMMEYAKNNITLQIGIIIIFCIVSVAIANYIISKGMNKLELEREDEIKLNNRRFKNG